MPPAVSIMMPLAPAGVGVHELAEQGDEEDGELGSKKATIKASNAP